MKLLVSYIFLILFPFLCAAQSFKLNIEKGYGSGTFNIGDTVHIWSNPCAKDQVFLNWSGSGVQFLAFEDEWHTILITPDDLDVSEINLKANFDDLPDGIETGKEKFAMFGIDSSKNRISVDKAISFRIPPNPKGVVILFHGTNGSGRTYFSRYERVQLMNDFLYNGYAVFGLDCNERTLGDINSDENIRWVTKDAFDIEPEDNIDLENVQETVKQIFEKHNFSQSMPIFSFGVSNGANFSDLAASVLGFKASAHVTATGRLGTYGRDDVSPVIWVMSENDHQELADNAKAYKNYKKLLKRQPSSEFHVFKRSPMFPQRFMRNSGDVSEQLSSKWYHKLEDKDLLDDDNYISNLIVESFLEDFIASINIKPKQEKGVKDQLLCANADHTLSADYNKNIIRFFDAQLEKTNTTNTILDSFVEIYPNPVTNILYLTTNNFDRFALYNSKSQLLMNGNIRRNQIDVANNPKGFYFLKLWNAKTNMQQVTKVIIE